MSQGSELKRCCSLHMRTTGGTDAEPQRRFCSSVKHEDEDCSQWDFSRALTENLTGLEFEICSVQNLVCSEPPLPPIM